MPGVAKARGEHERNVSASWLLHCEVHHERFLRRGTFACSSTAAADSPNRWLTVITALRPAGRAGAHQRLRPTRLRSPM